MPGFFANLEAQTIFQDVEVIFVLNEPDYEEISVVNSFSKKYPDRIKMITASPVETLGKSWNRAWQEARGEFVCAWNVDDIREADSLERQLTALKINPACSFCYGDFIIVDNYGSRKGIYTVTPVFDKGKFLRSFLSGGAFMVWRRNLYKDIGFFDEQLKSALDFDFVLRIILKDIILCRADGVMGYFTNTHSGLSTSKSHNLSLIEETLIYTRYGIFDKVKKDFFKDINDYKIDSVFYQGEWHYLTNIIPNYDEYITDKKPLWIKASFYSPFKSLLMQFHLWNIAVNLKHIVSRRIQILSK